MLIILVLLLILGFVYTIKKWYTFENNLDLIPVYCLMITGKSQWRRPFAFLSIQNFLKQTYHNKYLVIINHGQPLNVQSPNVTEIVINKDLLGLSLGDLRNLALDQVPDNGAWFPWDDDDYRHPELLSYLVDQMTANQADVISLSSRIEYNHNQQFIWQMIIQGGMVLILAKKIVPIRYLTRDSMEDVTLLQQCCQSGHRLLVVNNDPNYYIRLVHQNNTSRYVKPDKRQINLKLTDRNGYYELPVTQNQRNYLFSVVHNYYRSCLKSLPKT